MDRCYVGFEEGLPGRVAGKGCEEGFEEKSRRLGVGRVQSSAMCDGAWASEVSSPSLVNGFRT